MSGGLDNAKATYNKNAPYLNTVNWDQAPNKFPEYTAETAEVIARKYHNFNIQNNSNYILTEYGLKYFLTLARITTL